MCKKQYIRKYKLIQSFNSIYSSLTFDKTFLSPFVDLYKKISTLAGTDQSANPGGPY